jgi:hypothetical protein
LTGAGRSTLTQVFLSSRVHLISETADHIVESFHFNGDTRVDEVFKSRGVAGDGVKFHGDRLGGIYLHAIFDECAKMEILFVLVLDCKVSLPGSDGECFDQLFETVLEATDAARMGYGEGSVFMGGGQV